MNVVEEANDYKPRKNCCGPLSFSPLQKCMIALRMLACSKTTYVIDTENPMGETTCLDTRKQFARAMMKVIGPDYLREPSVEDT